MKLEIKEAGGVYKKSAMRMDNDYSLCTIDKEDYGIFEEIVRRSNLHEELIEASKELLADVLNLLEKNNSVKLGTMGMLHIVRVQQAIKKATNNTQG